MKDETLRGRDEAVLGPDQVGASVGVTSQNAEVLVLVGATNGAPSMLFSVSARSGGRPPL